MSLVRDFLHTVFFSGKGSFSQKSNLLMKISSPLRKKKFFSAIFFSFSRRSMQLTTLRLYFRLNFSKSLLRRYLVHVDENLELVDDVGFKLVLFFSF